MKIFFRYLFMRMLQPFCICMAACTVIWIMADLYGNMDDFLDHKVNFLLVIRFYLLQIPKMLVQVLPAAVLFSMLFTLLSLNRRSELVALQSGGMAPVLMFSPFVLFTVIMTAVLALDLSGPASSAEVTRERLLKQVKGQSAGINVFENLPYVDTVNRRVWYFQSLNTGRNTAQGVVINLSDADGHDIKMYCAQTAEWTGDYWRLKNVKKIVYNLNGSIQDQKILPVLDLPDINTPPKTLSLIVSQPEQLTLSQLSQYLDTSTQTPEYLAKYRTEWWYRVLYPLSLIVLMFYALLQGTKTDRRSAVAGVFGAIFILLGYTMLMNVFMAAGNYNRLSPVVSILAPEILFGLVGLHLLAIKNGWWWQLREFWKSWREDDVEDEKDATA